MHTLDELKVAEEALASIKAKWESYSGNNPDKYRTDIRIASEKVDAIRAALKISGVIELTPQEILEKELDEQFPKARSRDIVSYKGKSYQLKFVVSGKSRSGKTVTGWHRFWVEVATQKVQ